MLYLKEIQYRVLYSFLTIVLLFCGIFWYKQYFLVLLTYFLYETNEYVYFFFTHPSELIYIYLLILICYSFYFGGTFLFWQFLDYRLAGCLVTQVVRLKKQSFRIIGSIHFVNYLNVSFFLPNVWYSFNILNEFFISSLEFDTFQELKILDFFIFIFFYLILFNLFYLLLIGFVFSLKYISIIKLFEQKNMFFFIFFLLLLTCFDWLIAFSSFFCCWGIIEMLLFSRIYFLKIQVYLINISENLWKNCFYI